MKRDCHYITLDGRGDSGSFHQRVIDELARLKEDEGLHIIKEFEPLPLYSLMESKSMERYTEKKKQDEYHVWFYPKVGSENIEMKKHLTLDNERIKKMLDIKVKVFRKEITPELARKLVNETFTIVTPEEFAYGEQHMLSFGINNEVMVEGMDDIIDVFRDVLQTSNLDLPKGHPINTYTDEAFALEQLVQKMENRLNTSFIKNEWLAFYEKLNQINIHFSRKQNQLFSALERKGFDRPSTVMWSFDNKVRDAVKSAYLLLEANDDTAFIEAQPNVIYLVRDILAKERKVLYPTSLKLLSNEEFAAMRESDDEIGYCLIDTPPPFEAQVPGETDPGKITPSSDLLSDLTAVLQKHGVGVFTGAKDDVLDVSTGKLILEQINLVFKHLQVDLSYVDENDIVKFYSDTKHRVFPRSAGVIGRKVQNCHPRESVAAVEGIIEAFRKGEQDKAEFWIEMGNKFIYIIYNAVRDENGKYRGVLEMMQDVTHIRSLTGSRRLLAWDNSNTINEEQPVGNSPTYENFGIHSKTIIAPLLKKYPYLKNFLIKLNPKYSQLSNPVVFNTMGNIASLEMIAKRGGYEVDDFVQKIITEVSHNEKN